MAPVRVRQGKKAVIASASLHSAIPLPLRADILPFLLLYALAGLLAAGLAPAATPAEPAWFRPAPIAPVPADSGEGIVQAGFSVPENVVIGGEGGIGGAETVAKGGQRGDELADVDGGELPGDVDAVEGLHAVGGDVEQVGSSTGDEEVLVDASGASEVIKGEVMGEEGSAGGHGVQHGSGASDIASGERVGVDEVGVAGDDAVVAEVSSKVGGGAGDGEKSGDAENDEEGEPYAWEVVFGGGVAVVTGLVHLLVVLSTVWSVPCRARVRYRPARRVEGADVVMCIPRPHGGKAELCPLVRHVAAADMVSPVNVGSKKSEPLHDEQGQPGSGSYAIAVPTLSFSFQQAAFCWVDDGEDDGEFRSLDFPDDCALSYYRSHKGHCSTSHATAVAKWGANKFDVPIPSFWELYQEHAVAPFFVFQVLSVGLWMMDDNWHFAVFTLLMLVAFEAIAVVQRVRNLTVLRSMERPSIEVYVFREGAWESVSSDTLVPGDIISVPRSEVVTRPIRESEAQRKKRVEAMKTNVRKEGKARGIRSDRVEEMVANVEDSPPPTTTVQAACPCDAVILRGSCVANEAMLTGESVPMLKEPLSDDVAEESTPLQAFEGSDRKHAKNCVFAGTQILVANADKGNATGSVAGIRAPPDRGCIAMVARTGFSTSQGDLMRTILFATEHTTAANSEALMFLMCLLVFAVIAAWYVLEQGLQDESKSRFKLLLHCAMIVTAVVPPELPMQLSLAVTASLASLAQERIYCTAPFRIPFAGRVDIACYDKTGTLTSDQFLVRGVAWQGSVASGDAGGAGGDDGDDDFEEGMPLLAVEDCQEDTLAVLGSCHSLATVGGDLAGDPMEKAVADSIGWTVTGSDLVGPARGGLSNMKDASRGKGERIRILKRFQFESALKRMTCIVSLEHKDRRVAVVAKGAPETIRELLGEVPEHYDVTFKHLALEGARVLALAYKEEPDASPTSVRAWSRAETESDLNFAGFLVLDCPLKRRTADVIRSMQHSGHRVVMVTGDNPLTALSVASKVNMLRHGDEMPLAVLVCSSEHADTVEELEWQEVGPHASEERIDFVPSAVRSMCEKYELCITGAALGALRHMHAQSKSSALADALRNLEESARVFARVSPKQKEHLVSDFNAMGYTTMMCGDGTNDVGALTQAHVGVSVINNPEKEVRSSRRREQGDRTSGSESSRRRTGRASSRREKPMEEMLGSLAKALEKEQAASDKSIVKFGDASIASPFTSKMASIMSTVAIVRQGRCALVTTLQMYKILAINSILISYMLSVMYLHGVKTGDTQQIVIAMLVAFTFLALSRSSPLDRLSKEKPPSGIFAPRIVFSIILQCAVHLYFMHYIVQLCEPYADKNVDPDGDFEPNIINSVVFLLTATMNASIFLVNYWGRPFMVSLRENVWFFRLVVANYALCFLAASELFEPINEALDLVPMPTDQLRYSLLMAMTADSVLVYGIEFAVKKMLS